MTELSARSATPPPTGPTSKPGTFGVTVPNTECRIVDPATGDDQRVGGEGELWVRGPQVMKGYLNNAEATAATIDDDGWLHTGDVAVIDEDHHVSIVDRVKELIKYKGFQVPPAELEALLITHPQVARRGRDRRPRRRGRRAAEGVRRRSSPDAECHGRGAAGVRRRARRARTSSIRRSSSSTRSPSRRAARSCAACCATRPMIAVAQERRMWTRTTLPVSNDLTWTNSQS